MRRGGIDRLLRRGRIGQVDAAEFELLMRRRYLRRRVVHACQAGAARQRLFGDDPAERTEGAGHDNDFSVHDEPPYADEKGTHTSAERISFAMRRISHPNAGIEQNIPAEDDEMNDVSRSCDKHPDLTNFKHRLPRLKAALQSNRKVRIVAIGSSSTAGVGSVLPYPPRL